MLEPWQLLLLAAVGLMAGFLNVLAGGGSLLTLPAMIFLGLPPATANGTNRIAILAQNFAAVAGFRKQGFADFRLSLKLAACGIPGALAGAFFAIKIDPVWFKRLLAAIMIAVLVQVLRPKKRRAPVDGSVAGQGRGREWWAHLWMIAIGFYVGFIQAGVGFVLMAVLEGCLRLDLVRVNMHKVFLVGIFTVPAFLVFALSGEMAWLAGIVLAIGNAAGGWIGSHVAVAKGEKVIRIVFAFAVAATAVKLLLG